MLGKLVRLIRSSNSTPASQHPLLPRILAAVGNEIGEAKGFAEQLIPAAEAALNYFENEIASIPGSQELATDRLADGSSLASLFADSDDIGRALGRSLAVKEALPALIKSGCDEIHALLGMRLKSTNAAGTAMPPVFADHTLRSLAGDAGTTRELLRLAAFDRLLLDFAEHVGKLRRKDRMLKIEWEWNLQHDAARVMAAEPQAEYVYAANELTPENQLKGLLTWLSTPECFFRLEPANASASGQPSLPLLRCSDRRHWLVCLVRFSADDAIAALERETHNHRYILI